MKQGRVLGKGLSALIAGAEESGRLGEREVRHLALTVIGLNPNQPRKSFDENSLRELADSVGQVGILQPVLVRRLRAGETAARLSDLPGGAPDETPGEPAYCVVAGERRVRAARLAGLPEVPAIICTYEETEALRVALLENIQREDLNALEEAEAYRRLLDAYGATQEELATLLGKNRSTVTNTLRLLGLEAEIQQLLRDGGITRGHAKALLSVPDAAARLRLARLCRARGLSVRECERRAQALVMEGPPGPARGGRKRAVAAGEETREVRALRERAERYLGAPVVIERDAKTKHGVISVRFFSDDDLERVLAAMGVDADLS
ncbi:MAG: ParB/RepB/Spo0J family partition protein [Candidatus Krumholzibacteriia bacterium]